jgi:hypothetical protein
MPETGLETLLRNTFCAKIYAINYNTPFSHIFDSISIFYELNGIIVIEPKGKIGEFGELVSAEPNQILTIPGTYSVVSQNENCCTWCVHKIGLSRIVPLYYSTILP